MYFAFSFVGAVASSAPVFATVNFPQYMDVVTASLETTGQDCVRNIDNATKTMQALLTTEEGAKQLTELFEWVNFLYLDFLSWFYFHYWWYLSMD